MTGFCSSDSTGIVTRNHNCYPTGNPSGFTTLSHLNAALHVVCYLASPMDNGISFSYDAHAHLNSFLHYPLLADALSGYSDSNWGPMDASKLKPHASPVECHPDSFWSISGSIIMYSNGPDSWGAQRQTLTALSSSEAEINATNKNVKSILELCFLLRDLHCLFSPLSQSSMTTKVPSIGVKAPSLKRHVTLISRKIMSNKILIEQFA